ncbi:MAG: HAMP domain-containing histidine kinase [Planctomycetales bacterium]|nr:HAMP domain-containing histidine kinase [Planctomycetales bacterium]
MSYTGLKRVLGETNLERKCRLLFGTCLLILITTSFWWYGARTDKIVLETNSFVARILVNQALQLEHMNVFTQNMSPRVGATAPSLDEKTNIALANLLRTDDFEWLILHPDNDRGIGKPTNNFEWDLVLRWQRLGATLQSEKDINAAYQSDDAWAQDLVTKPIEPQDGVNRVSDATKEEPAEKAYYRYYQPLFARQGCVDCHRSIAFENMPAWPDLKVGDLLAVVRVDLDMDRTLKKQAKNRSLLLFAAIATVFLAMAALYAIVRYVIVKPLKHLRDVSNAVRRGEVETRAVIETGDEFEELGAAFNRMLRQLLRQQDELRNVNGELDGKIDELAQVNMRLYEMNQIKSDFLATVSHELRTPLNSIIGFSDLLANIAALDEKQRRYASNIERSGKHLLEMINDILDLAKIESGRMQVRPSEFDIGSVVLMQCDMARPLSEKKRIDLACEIAPGLPTMHQDRGKIEQVLNNLLSNAIKFTPDGGRIQVSARQDRRGDLRLTVADTGVGISEADQTVIFEKFRQGGGVQPGGNAMTREFSGTGLGLSIVREMCRLLGGDVTVSSELGRGSEFTVVLPWSAPEQVKIESPIADELRELTKPRPEMAMFRPSGGNGETGSRF